MTVWLVGLNFARDWTEAGTKNYLAMAGNCPTTLGCTADLMFLRTSKEKFIKFHPLSPACLRFPWNLIWGISTKHHHHLPFLVTIRRWNRHITCTGVYVFAHISVVQKWGIFEQRSSRRRNKVRFFSKLYIETGKRDRFLPRHVWEGKRWSCSFARHEGIWWHGRMAPLILNLASGWRWAATHTPRPFYVWRKSPCQSLDRRLGGPHSRAGRCGVA